MYVLEYTIDFGSIERRLKIKITGDKKTKKVKTKKEVD
jgi:hypothetical protein